MIKHFIDIDEYTKNEIDTLVANAKLIKKNPGKYKDYLKNTTLGLLFQKQSLRTRLSFSIGIQKMGGKIIELDSKSIGFGSRESVKDILKTFSQYIDCLMIRNNDHKKILYLKSLNYLPIINGLSDYSHPCQILSDLLTIEETIGEIKNKFICWVGDFNNVLRSLIHLQKIYLFKLNVVLPKEIINKNKQILIKYKNKNLVFTNDIKAGVLKTNCVMTDAWVSMGESDTGKLKYFEKFQINKNIMKMARKDAIFMHCLPAHREKEVSSEVLDSNQSVVWKQAKNRMFAQQAVLRHIIKRK